LVVSRCPPWPAAAVAVAAFAASSAISADVRGSKLDADVLKQKIAAIADLGDHPSRQPRRTTLSEKEMNAYLAYEAGPDLPPGVVEPTLTILGTGRLAARAVVDLDAVRKQKNPTSLLDPMYYLAGRVPVTATGVLSTSQGVGRLQLESAAVGGVPIPKIVLQEIVGYYSRTPEKPDGVSLDDPFVLPAHIREIQVERGQATIIQ
jgi:hypothetical protein